MQSSVDPLGPLREAQQAMLRQIDDLDQELAAVHARRARAQEAYAGITALITQLGRTAESTPTSDRGMDGVIMNWASSSVADVEVKVSSSPDPGELSTREAIVFVVEHANRPLATHEVVRAVRAVGVDSQAATIRSLLSKMSDKDEIAKVRRGLYWRKGATVPEETPTFEEYLEMHGEQPGQDYHPAEFDEPVPDPELSDAEYRQWARVKEQAHLEDQADREDNTK